MVQTLPSQSLSLAAMPGLRQIRISLK
jgi:hypothetical protein